MPKCHSCRYWPKCEEFPWDESGCADFVLLIHCQNCNWWHRHKGGDTSRGVCDKYAVSKNENGYCDEPLLEERKFPWKN